MSDQDDLPYFKKMINEITGEDTQLLVIGKIVTKNSDLEFIISDDTGKIHVILPELNSLSTLKKSTIIKVLGSYNADSKNLMVEFLEELGEFNFDMYKKVYKLKKSIKT